MMKPPSDHAADAISELGEKASYNQLSTLFLRLGVTAFGGPAVHIAMMEDEVVNRRRWLSRQRFLDLLGAANLLPGPSSSELAIYIGQSQAGWAGLLLSGICFVLPAALLTCRIAGPDADPYNLPGPCRNLRHSHGLICYRQRDPRSALQNQSYVVHPRGCGPRVYSFGAAPFLRGRIWAQKDSLENASRC